MDGLHIEDAAHAPHNTMQQHFHQKLGKPMDMGQKTPLRGGLGLLVNESKTPGAKSLQGMASARKTALTSTLKKTIPYDNDYEVFQDEPEEEIVMRQPQSQKPSCCSPVDFANRCDDDFDSLGADIMDDVLNYQDRSVVLADELPMLDSPDPISVAEQEAIAALGLEEWDEYPPVDVANRMSDNYDYPISIDEFRVDDAMLVDGEYAELFNDPEAREGLGIDRDLLEGLLERMRHEAEQMSIEDSLGEPDSVLSFNM